MKYYYFVIILLLIFSCTKKRHQQSFLTNDTTEIDTPIYAHLFLENSGSMNGYLNGSTEFIEVVSNLNLPQHTQFYYINSAVYPITTDYKVFIDNLNLDAFKTFGTPVERSRSDLNQIFETILTKVNNDSIAILITDGIYSIKDEVYSGLMKAKGKTKINFKNKLLNQQFVTQVFKFESRFNGNYYSYDNSAHKIDQKRPYYIWLFYPPQQLEKIPNLFKSLQTQYATFDILNSHKIFYSIVKYNRIGRFQRDRKVRSKDRIDAIKGIKKSRNSDIFQFSIAVDFSSILQDNLHFLDTNNYNLSDTYRIIDIIKFENLDDQSKRLIEDDVVEHITHIITIQTDKSPYGEIELCLKYKLAKWVTETHIDNDQLIDSAHTFGFKYLIGAIDEAYKLHNINDIYCKINLIVNK